MASQFFTEHIGDWTSKGFQVDLVCSKVGGRYEDLEQLYRDVPMVKLSAVSLRRSPFSLSNVRGYRELKALLKQEEYDTIVTNEPVMGLVTRLAARKCKASRVIYIAHGFHFYRGGSKIRNFIFRSIESFAARFTDVLITLNHEDHEAAQEFRLREQGYVAYLPGIGVNLKRFCPAQDAVRDKMRSELGLKADDIAIVTTAELSQNKNQQVLISALPSLHRQCANVHLIFIGKGPDREKYERMAAELKLTEYVHFLGYRKDVPAILQACDIGAAASYREGLPLNLIEEMATGLPIVASNNRGHRDIVCDSSVGFLFDPSDPEDFVRVVTPLCQDASLRKRMGENNLESCKRFDIALVRSALAKIID